MSRAKWEWLSNGRADFDKHRGRIYYQAVRFTRLSDGSTRKFFVGDTVSVASFDGFWFAQIVEMFQVNPRLPLGTTEEPELKTLLEAEEVLRRDELESALNTLGMRLTLRWFYDINEVPELALRSSPVPRPLASGMELYFSDHVEKSGSNSVEVIDGFVFLYASLSQYNAKKKAPPPQFNPISDTIGLVRCFVRSNTHNIRELSEGELKRLLDKPSTSSDLYEKGLRKTHKSQYGMPMAAVKGLGKSRRRWGGNPVISAEQDLPVETAPQKTNRDKHASDVSSAIESRHAITAGRSGTIALPSPVAPACASGCGPSNSVKKRSEVSQYDTAMNKLTESLREMDVESREVVAANADWVYDRIIAVASEKGTKGADEMDVRTIARVVHAELEARLFKKQKRNG